MADDRHLTKSKKRPYFRNALTDLNKIWRILTLPRVSAVKMFNF